jgi:hypothetical protein
VAVEFALVSLILFPLVFGIIDYGLWFTDSMNSRAGVREAARRAVVRNFPTTGACSTGTDMEKIKCLVKQEVGSVSGPTYVKVVTPTAGWSRGQSLKVCAMIKVNAATGLVPIPNDRLIRAKTEMSIENDAPPLPTGIPATADTLPTGASWAWCP